MNENDNGKIEYKGMKKDGFSAWFDNYWYHNKWKTIIAAFLIIVFAVCVYQLVTRDVPDAYFMYAGPDYISAGDVIRIKDALRSTMTDYNGDGELGITLVTLTYVTDEKIEAMKKAAYDAEEEFYIDLAANAQNKRQFDMEIFAGEAVICFLEPELYKSVRDVGGFMKMSEIFTNEELSDVELYDDCGIYLSSTKFGKYFGGMSDLDPDTVLCIRRVATITAFKGKKKYEKIHDYHVSAFRSMVTFEYPEGYVPPETDAGL